MKYLYLAISAVLLAPAWASASPLSAHGSFDLVITIRSHTQATGLTGFTCKVNMVHSSSGYVYQISRTMKAFKTGDGIKCQATMYYKWPHADTDSPIFVTLELNGLDGSGASIAQSVSTLPSLTLPPTSATVKYDAEI